MYAGASGIIIVYDITSKRSFENAKHFLNDVKNSTRYQPDMKFLLIGNKVDDHKSRQVQFNEGKIFANDNQMLFSEVSAKSGQGVEEILNKFAFSLCQINEKEFSDFANLFGKTSMEEMKINVDLLKNPQFAEIDKYGIAHFYPQQSFGNNYQKYCMKWSKRLTNNEIITIVNEYTDKETKLCTKLNLILAADSEEIKEHSEKIKSLRQAIYRLAEFYPVNVKKVYRGMDSSEKEFSKFQLGKIVYLPSFTSTSQNDQKFYQDQKQNSIVIINLPIKPSSAFVVTRKYSKNADNDEEVLFACYSKFKVMKTEMDKNFQGKLFKYYIELEAVQQRYYEQEQINSSNLIFSAMMFSN